MNSATCFSPSPSMSIAPRETKCLSSCHWRPGHSAVGALGEHPVAGLTVGVSQSGQRFGRLGARAGDRPLDGVRGGREHLGDHVTGAQDDDLVAGADVLALDVLLVVQRGQLDRDPAHVHRLEHREGVQVAELADVPVDALQLGDRGGGGNFQAIAQRGSRPTMPRRRCSSWSRRLITTPSISKSSAPAALLPGQALGDHVVLAIEQLDVGIDAKAVRRAATAGSPSGWRA